MFEGKTGRGEKINGGRPARHPAGALRAFKFAPGEFVELLFQFQTPPKPKKKKAPTSCKGLFFSNLVGVRGFEPPAPASRIQVLGVNWLFLLSGQEASTDNIAGLCITMQY